MRKEILMEVAFEKFALKGYHTTLSEIAQGAGIKKQSIYNHFENKDDLLYETIKKELIYFYSTKSLEFDKLMDLDLKEVLKSMFYSICNYYKDINKLMFWKWILLIDSKELFTKCRELIRINERKLYNRIKLLLERENIKIDITKDILMSIVQTFMVMVHGVLDGILLYNDVYDSQTLIENTWNFYWKSMENLLEYDEVL